MRVVLHHLKTAVFVQVLLGDDVAYLSKRREEIVYLSKRREEIDVAYRRRLPSPSFPS